MQPLSFGIPLSLGALEVQRRISPHAVSALARALGRPIEPFYVSSYEELSSWLFDGTLAAAWAPPTVGVQAWLRGAAAPLCFVRGGRWSYRGALFALRARQLALRTLLGTSAAWVEPASMGGHLLGKLILRGEGLAPESLFRKQRFLGSYQAVFQAVLEGHADVGASFVPGGSPAPWCWRPFAAGRLQDLEVLRLSPEIPNDGIVFSPWLAPGYAAELGASFSALAERPEGRALLASIFEAEGLATPAEAAYREVLAAVAGEPERLRGAWR